MEPVGWRLRASSDANSGHPVEYALTSRTFFFQPDDFAHGISPNGGSMAEDEAPIEVVLCGTSARRFAGNITPSEKS
jgi:hypothetical protein